MEKPQKHILVACYPAQGHINPALRLAKRLARESGAAAAAAARITFSTAVSAHRRMFPNQNSGDLTQNDLLSYIPYSNGYDDGYGSTMPDMYEIQKRSATSLAAIVDDLAARGPPVTCIIYSFFMSSAADIALSRNIPSFLFWIQPATAFALYWHYFHDYETIAAAAAGDPSAAVNLPSLPPMTPRDLPSFMVRNRNSTDDIYAAILPLIRDMFVTLDAEIAARGTKPRVIVNTADEMEAAAIASVAAEVKMVGIGPLLEDVAEGSLFESDDENDYMDWLDGKGVGSVVYVSFGSISVLRREQVEEIWKGLRGTQRPFLWVVRKDSRWEGMEFGDGEKQGMVVEWCAQGRVLAHKAVGCFVTHCGWNSTVESLVSGVATVAVPQWSDQTTNAWLMEREWGTGVRVGVNYEGVVEAEEIRRCVESVMGDGEIRRKAGMWKERVRRAILEGGSSERNLKDFVHEFAT